MSVAVKKIKAVIDVNPFFTYIAGFLLALIVYQLDWSYLFPPISFSLFFFIIITFLKGGAIGFYLPKKKVLRFYNHDNKLNVKLWVLAITVGFIFEFIYARNIPFLSILNKNVDIEY